MSQSYVPTLTECMRRCPDHGHHDLVRGAPVCLLGDPGAQYDGSGPDGLRPVTRVTNLRGLHVYRDPTRGGLDNLSDLLVQVIQVIGAEVTLGGGLGAEDVREAVVPLIRPASSLLARSILCPIS